MKGEGGLFTRLLMFYEVIPAEVCNLCARIMQYAFTAWNVYTALNIHMLKHMLVHECN